MKIITVNNEKIAIPEAKDCIGNTTFTVYTQRYKYPVTISQSTTLDTLKQTSSYKAVATITAPHSPSRYKDIFINGGERGAVKGGIADGHYFVDITLTRDSIISVEDIYELAIGTVLIYIISEDNAIAKTESDIRISQISSDAKDSKAVIRTLCEMLADRDIKVVSNSTQCSIDHIHGYIIRYHLICSYKDRDMAILYFPASCTMEIHLYVPNGEPIADLLDKMEYRSHNIKTYKDFMSIIDLCLKWIF